MLLLFIFCVKFELISQSCKQLVGGRPSMEANTRKSYHMQIMNICLISDIISSAVSTRMSCSTLAAKRQALHLALSIS